MVSVSKEQAAKAIEKGKDLESRDRNQFSLFDEQKMRQRKRGATRLSARGATTAGGPGRRSSTRPTGRVVAVPSACQLVAVEAACARASGVCAVLWSRHVGRSGRRLALLSAQGWWVITARAARSKSG